MRDYGRQQKGTCACVGSNRPVLPKTQAQRVSLSKEKEGREHGAIREGIHITLNSCVSISQVTEPQNQNQNSRPSKRMDLKKKTRSVGDGNKSCLTFFYHECLVPYEDLIFFFFF